MIPIQESIGEPPARHAAPGGADAVVVGTAADGREWDAFVEGHGAGTADHLWSWRVIFGDVFGHECRYLIARRGGTVTGVLPLVLVRSRIFGRLAVSLPYLNDGGLLVVDEASSASLLDVAAEVGRDFGAAHVELRHRSRQCPELACRQHKLGFVLRLPASADELWNGLDRKVRNQVRKARKEGLESEVGGAELVGAFYPVFAENMRDLGTPVYPRRLFEAVCEVFGERARVHVVRHDGRPVAGGLTIAFGETTVNPWASSLREFRRLSPNMLLYWAMLEAALAGGASAFDFGRSSPGAGTHQFKLQWGASEIPLHWEYLRLGSRDLPDHSATNPKMRWAVEAWKRLPIRLANSLGPAITRHLP